MLHLVLEIFLWLFGLCVGSFLNVVIYRLPAGLSIKDPPRSFCPRCHHLIRWHDNLPVLSWLMLGGRCRDCGVCISVQYPLIEAITGLVFVLVYHLLFFVGARVGVPVPLLPQDLTLLLVWLALAAGMIACAGMDIVSYTVDVRVTDVVLVIGLVGYALWPRENALVPAAAATSVLAGTGAFAVSALMLWLTVWRRPGHPETAAPDEESSASDNGVPTQGETEPPAVRQGAHAAIVIVILVTASLIITTAVGVSLGWTMAAIGAALVILFTVIVLAGAQQRVADEEIRVAIEEERPQARGVALRELAWLGPIIIAGASLAILSEQVSGVHTAWVQAMRWSPGASFAPLAGLSLAAFGAMVGAAAGWVLRIFFTLAFGREAFGVGDIYILAAAGAAAGWDIALIGLVLSVGIALAGWLISSLLKSSIMIPFGPWLALGFLAALWLNRRASELAVTYRDNLLYAWQEQPQIIAIIAGLMMVATAASIVLARLVRRWVEPESV